MVQANTTYYFKRIDDEHCFRKKYWDAYMKENGLTQIDLFIAKPISDDQYFFCKAVGEVGEKGHCGKECEDYAPRNGKSGCCKHLGKLYEPTESITIFLNH